jgi:Flp pilus assembly pilin Flp
MDLEVHTMTLLLFTLWRDEAGQDLIEYTLLLAFMMFCVIGMIGFGSASIKGIVSTSNSQISAGNAYAQGS